jgi:peptide methionine sulfoxide reductase MsrB
MHYVAVKSPEHQARAVAYRTHQCFVGQRTQMINALRSHLAEFGHVFAQGAAHVKDIRIAIDNEALNCLMACARSLNLSRADRHLVGKD